MANSTTDAIRHVKRALDELAAALVRTDAQDLLGAEAALAVGTTALTRLDRAALPEDREAVRRLILETTLTLARCQRLGATVGDLMSVYAAHAAYGRDGRAASPTRVPGRVGS